MLTKENIGILKSFQEDLETARLGREGCLLALKLAAIPERIVERLGGKPYNIGIRNEVCSQLTIEDVCSCLAYVREIRNKTAEIVSDSTRTGTEKKHTKLVQNSMGTSFCESTCSIWGFLLRKVPHPWA